jgi:hypothetical protein
MSDVTARVEERARKQSIPIFKRDHLTSMKMSGENQVKAAFARSFPD